MAYGLTEQGEALTRLWDAVRELRDDGWTVDALLAEVQSTAHVDDHSIQHSGT